MFDERRGLLGGLCAAGLGPCDLFVEDGKVTACFDVIAECFERPERDVAVAVGLLDPAEGIGHEPLRPVVFADELVTVGQQDDFAAAFMTPKCQQHFHGPLGDIARAPCTAIVLLDAVRNCEVDHAIVDEPWKDVVHPRDGMMFVNQTKLP